MSKRVKPEKILQPKQILNREVIDVPFEDIIPPTDGVPASKFLIQSIDEWGLINPLLVVNQKGGRIQIVAGRRRWDAIRQIRQENPDKFSTIPVKIIEAKASDLTVGALTILENHSRSDNPLADAFAIKELQLKGVSADEIFEATGLMKAQQGLKLSLLQLLPELIEYLKDGTLSVKLAEKVAILSKETQERFLLIARERWEVSQGKTNRFTHNDYREVKLAKRVQTATALFESISDNLAVPGDITEDAEGQFIDEGEARSKADAAIPAWVLRTKQEILILRALFKRVEGQDDYINHLFSSLENVVDDTAEGEGLTLPKANK